MTTLYYYHGMRVVPWWGSHILKNTVVMCRLLVMVPTKKQTNGREETSIMEDDGCPAFMAVSNPQYNPW